MTTEASQPSDRSRATALALALPLGFFGAHRFYAGRTGSGLLMLCTLGGAGLWWLYDVILIAAGEFRDAQGRLVVHWIPSQSRERALADPRRQELLLDEVDALRSEVTELAERVDFLERMVTEVRHRAIPGGRSE